MRIEEHPILTFKRGKQIKFFFEERDLIGYEGDTIASALHDSGVKILRHSIEEDRPRGFFCAIGRCSSCYMIVDDKPNVRVCVTPLKEGMKIYTQEGLGKIYDKD